MDILEVYPKDWHVRLELTLTEITMLLDFLDKCEFQGDLTDKRYAQAKEYVTGDFFPKLDKLFEEMVRRSG
jgi:hypothetical protein